MQEILWDIWKREGGEVIFIPLMLPDILGGNQP
jgi:hypothetical protein